MISQCTGITRTGKKCPNPAIRGDFCFAHAPDLAAARKQGNRAGGYGKRTERRIAKRMPADLKDTLATLYRVMAAVESGEMEPARASAIAAVSRAIVGVYDAGLVEAKLAELEAKIGSRVA
jgi:hypothetical protein